MNLIVPSYHRIRMKESKKMVYTWTFAESGTRHSFFFPVVWVCRIHRLHHCWWLSPRHKIPGYGTKISDGEVPVMLDLLGMTCSSLMPSLPGPIWSGVIAPVRDLSIWANITKLYNMQNSIAWKRTVLTFKQRAYVRLNLLKKKFFYDKLNCLK